MRNRMRFTMYSYKASILYLSCAEIGTMGDDSPPCLRSETVNQSA